MWLVIFCIFRQWYCLKTETVTTDNLASDDFEIKHQTNSIQVNLNVPKPWQLGDLVIVIVRKYALSFTVPINSLFSFQTPLFLGLITICFIQIHLLSSCFYQMVIFLPILTISKSFRWFQYFQLFGSEVYAHLLTLSCSYTAYNVLCEFSLCECQYSKCEENIFYSHCQCLRFYNL